MKKKTAYIYKIKSKYVKRPELLLRFGFLKFEGEDEVIFARRLKLPEDSLLAVGLVKQIEFLYERSTTPEREEWEMSGYNFTEVLEPNQSTHFSLLMTDAIKEEITEAQLCVSLSELDKGCMFVNGPNKIAYYNVGVYEQCGEDLKVLISHLLMDGVIYRKKMKYGA